MPEAHSAGTLVASTANKRLLKLFELSGNTLAYVTLLDEQVSELIRSQTQLWILLGIPPESGVELWGVVHGFGWSHDH